MNTTQRTSVTPRGRSRLPTAALLFILHTSSLILPPLLLAATNDPSGALQRGLFEEEANRNLDAAIAAYQSVVTQFDQDRKLAGTAVFRLGECYRKLGRTNEAVVQYQRVLRDFSDQPTLVTLSRQDLTTLGAGPAAAAPSALSKAARLEQKRLLDAQIKLAEQDVDEVKKQFSVGRATESDIRAKERDVLSLRQQLAALDLGAEESPAGAGGAAGSEQMEIQRIQTLLAQSPDLINAPGKNGETLLQAAAGKGQLEVVQFLLDHGAAVNGIAQPDLTPLHFAAGNGHLAVVDLLLKRGAKPDRATADAITPLHLAVLRGYAQVAKGLIDAGAPVNARISPTPQTNIPEDLNNVGLRFGSTPLELAIENGYRGIAELLAAAKADLNGHVPFGNPPLINAVAASQKDMVELLLDHGADVNAADSNGNTALHRAAQNGSPELVSLLLAHKADVNAKDKAGNTPLHLAALKGNSAAIKALLAAKAKINVGNNQETTPLEMAALYDKREAAEVLLVAGADPNAGSGPAPLILAVACPDEPLARMLLEHGANPNAASGNYPTFNRNSAGTIQSVSLPLGHVTALEIACDQGNAVMVKLLLDRGADPNERRGEKRTPLLSLVVDKPEILRLLLEHKADPKLPDRQGETPLHAAVRLGNTNAVALLLAHGAEVNARDNAGNTPLYLAVIARNKDLVELLLAHQADPNLLNQFGQTPLDLTKQQAAQPSPGFPMPLQQVGAPPPKYASPAELADLLRQHGAQDWVPRPGQITVTRRSTGVTYPVFRQGTNALNHFTLFETIAALPWGVNSPVPFPDFSKVTITRRDPTTGKLTDIPMDVAALLAAGDCSKDVPLEWGDLVDIPDREHKLNEQWQGLPPDFVKSLAKCLERKVTVEVKGQPQSVTLAPVFRDLLGNQISLSDDRLLGWITLPFSLKTVLNGSARLLSTSDLTRVTVRRVDPATGQPREWIFNEQTVDPVNDLWVRDGDVIAVPEKP